MKKILKPLVVAVLVPLALSACGGGGGGSTSTTPTSPTTPTATFESKFGSSFAAFFDTTANTDPKTPVATDVPALNLTADPITNS